MLLGFASGLPLALTGQAMQAWLTAEGLSVSLIGFLALVGLPYTFKFLWAPLLDRFDLPGFGRRRGWIMVSQALIAVLLFALAGVSPVQSLPVFAGLALALAFASATQDVVVDAYRTDLLAPRERGLGSSLTVAGYRVSMIVSGGLTLIWTDPVQGGGWTWPEVYRLMAGLMLAAALLSAVLLPRVPAPTPLSGKGRHDLQGFFAIVLAVAVGVLATDRLVGPALRSMLAPWLATTGLAESLRGRWVDLATLLAGLMLTLPLAAWVSRKARYDTLWSGLRDYLGQPGAGAILLLIVLYKLGDAFAGALLTPFLLKVMAFASAEVGVVNKLFGLWLTILGALLGGALMLELGLYRALMGFGVLQLVSNLGFWWLASAGKGALPALWLPAFDWGFVSLAQPTPVDGGLLAVVAFENLSGGMGTAAFLALLMSLCNQRFTATQFALLSALASIGRVWVAPVAGVLAETIGWTAFFLISAGVAAPGLGLLWWLRREVSRL
jgi:PAT family beta-lactamase induction signal transducer AmpG